jgi:predicted nucleotidyltransferase
MILSFDPDQAVSAERRAEIIAGLADLARDENVRVLAAIESGSRAWGFHSPDSDYDIRFLYARRLDGYLALRPPRDVIERPIVGDIDLGGWDIAKALKLMARGNAIVAEWLSSPIIYCEEPGFRDAFTPLVHDWRSRFGDVAHYYGLARRQWAAFIEGREEVRLKKYFYVIRPAVALNWLRERPGDPPPMNLPAMLEGVTLPAETAAALLDLRERKQTSGEAVGVGPRIPALDAYLGAMMDWARAARLPTERDDGELWARSEAFFQSTILGAGNSGKTPIN